MANRGIYGFRKNNQDKVTFCNGDSFFEGLGKDIVKFIKETSKEKMEEIFDKIILVDKLQEATETQIQECKKYANLEVNIRNIKDFTCLLWKSIGRLETYRDEGLRYMIDASSEITNPHLCNYAYIINLDTNQFEIYALMYKQILQDRYNINSKDGEGRCRLIKEYPLSNIPNDWKEECYEIYNEDEIEE